MTSMILPLSEVETLCRDIIVHEGTKNGKFNIQAGSSKGDGYWSFITRVTVTNEEKDLNLIIKSAPTMKKIRAIAPIANAFDREIKFYDTIFTAMRKFQEKKQLKNPFNSIVKFYMAVKDENKEAIIMENITAKGFVLKDEKVQMDDDRDFLRYERPIAGMLQRARPSALEKLIALFKEEKDICRALEIFKENEAAFFTFLEKNKGNFTVLIHGGCWSNNMMFKYTNPSNQTKPTQVQILDFQLLRLGSPILDIAYFFYAGSSKKHLGQMVYYFDMYYEALKEQMSLMESSADEIVPKEKLWEDWKVYCKYAYLIVIKSALTESDEKVDLTDVTETGPTFETLWNRELRNQDEINQRLMDLTRHMYENIFLEM